MVGTPLQGGSLPESLASAEKRHPRASGFRGWCAVALLAALIVPPASAEDMPLPVEKQVPLILRVLTYDRQFEAKAGKEFWIGIVYNPAEPGSVKASNDVGETLTKYSGKTVKNLPINYYLVEYAAPAQLEAALKSRPGISVLYVCPGVKNLDNLLAVSRNRRITTTTGVPDLVERGVAVGDGG
jgi:hypothetical protein